MSRPAPDPRWMQKALEVARRGLGHVAPNPPVGAVLVQGESIVEGWHRRFGDHHAEVNCIEAARSSSVETAGADLYITLEPCSHHGKTPPCVETIIAAGIGRVIISTDDPNPVTSGIGYQKLADAGIEVVRDFVGEEGRYLVAPYLVHLQHGRPLVACKWAMTADGKIACSGGDSSWVTSEETREMTRRCRGHVDAILVGIQTVVADDPLLTCRHEDHADPLRVVIDPGCRIPLDARLLNSSPATVIYCRSESIDSEAARQLAKTSAELVGLPTQGDIISIDSLLSDLGNRGVQNLLVEGGAETHGHFLDAGRVDRVQVLIAPKLVGGRQAPGPTGGEGIRQMQSALDLSAVRWIESGPDRILEGAVTPEGNGTSTS